MMPVLPILVFTMRAGNHRRDTALDVIQERELEDLAHQLQRGLTLMSTALG